MRFISVDLPAFGSPISATKPAAGRAAVASRHAASSRASSASAARCWAARLEAARACARAAVLEPRLHREDRRVVGALAAEVEVGGRPLPARLRPFLQRGLGVARLRLAPRRCARPSAAGSAAAPPRARRRDRPRRSPPPSRRRAARSCAARRSASRSGPCAARRRGRRAAATSAQVSLRTSAFRRGASRPSVGGGVLGEQRLGDDEAEHPVAEELQPLVVGAGGHARDGSAPRSAGRAARSRARAGPRPRPWPG